MRKKGGKRRKINLKINDQKSKVTVKSITTNKDKTNISTTNKIVIKTNTTGIIIKTTAIAIVNLIMNLTGLSIRKAYWKSCPKDMVFYGHLTTTTSPPLTMFMFLNLKYACLD